MKQTIDLNSELREWLGRRLSEALGDNPDNIHHIMFNIHEAKDDIFRLFYDYQVQRNWPHVAANMQSITGIERGTTYKIRDRLNKNKKNAG